jgi:sulfur-oxidizing protein SoxY
MARCRDNRRAYLVGVPFTRRRVLLTLAAGLALPALAPPARATPGAMAEAIKRLIGARLPMPGRVLLTVPTVVETGNLVPVKVAVESPMSGADRVRAIHLVDDGNPAPDIASYRFGPAAGTAEIQTRVRLLQSQTIVALADMADGSVWSAAVEVTVAFGACADM